MPFLCRYPTFSDALRDLDDALTLVHLFATLPAEQSVGIPRAAVALASRLALEWQAYVVRTHALRAAFVAVKGFYYQAEVQGQKITWLVPHQLSQASSISGNQPLALFGCVIHTCIHMTGCQC